MQVCWPDLVDELSECLRRLGPTFGPVEGDGVVGPGRPVGRVDEDASGEHRCGLVGAIAGQGLQGLFRSGLRAHQNELPRTATGWGDIPSVWAGDGHETRSMEGQTHTHSPSAEGRCYRAHHGGEAQLSAAGHEQRRAGRGLADRPRIRWLVAMTCLRLQRRRTSFRVVASVTGWARSSRVRHRVVPSANAPRLLQAQAVYSRTLV